MRRRQAGWIVLAIAGWLAAPGAAGAEVTTERGSSILVWPKVIADGTRDTVVRITNTSNSLVRAHCFYVNAGLRDPELPEGPLNPRLWQEVDFTIALTRQQPTYWSVTEGRRVDPSDPPCNRNVLDCPYAGFDPGLVPPVVPDFVGELKCVQVDDSGAPFSGNALVGNAAIESRLTFGGGPGDQAQYSGQSLYNAIGIPGNDNNGDGTLVLGGGQCAQSGAICSEDEDCGGDGPCVREYGACPETWILNHLASNAPNVVLQEEQFGDAPTPVETELTIVPCTQNFETQRPTTVTIQFQTWNEFESQFSVSTSITCWGNFELGEIGAPALTFAGQLVPDHLGTMYLQTRMRSAEGTPYGLLMVAEEFHISKPTTLVDRLVTEGALLQQTEFVNETSAAANLHVEGERPVPDVITIPDEQLAR